MPPETSRPLRLTYLGPSGTFTEAALHTLPESVGAEIVPAYAGRSQGYPGLDQIVFTIPANVALRCDNTLEVRAAGDRRSHVTAGPRNRAAAGRR